MPWWVAWTEAFKRLVGRFGGENRRRQQERRDSLDFLDLRRAGSYHALLQRLCSATGADGGLLVRSEAESDVPPLLVVLGTGLEAWQLKELASHAIGLIRGRGQGTRGVGLDSLAALGAAIPPPLDGGGHVCSTSFHGPGGARSDLLLVFRRSPAARAATTLQGSIDSIRTALGDIHERDCTRLRSAIQESTLQVAADEAQLPEAVVRILSSAWEAAAVGLWIHNPDRGDFSAALSRGLPQRAAGRVEVAFLNALLGSLIKEQVSWRCAPRTELRFPEGVTLPPFDWVMAFPVGVPVSRDNHAPLGGAVVFASDGLPAVWDRRRMQAVADSMVLLGALHERGELRQRLRAVSALVDETTADDLDALLKTATHRVRTAVPCEAASVLLRTAEGGWEIALASVEARSERVGSEDAVQQHTYSPRHPVPLTPALRMIQEGARPVVLNDPSEVSRLESPASFPELSAKLPTTLMLIPLVGGTRGHPHPAGVLRCANRKGRVLSPARQPGRFSATDQETAMLLSHIVADYLAHTALLREWSLSHQKEESLASERDSALQKRERSMSFLRHELLAPIEPIMLRLEVFRELLRRKNELDMQTDRAIDDMIGQSWHVANLVDGANLLMDDNPQLKTIYGNIVTEVIQPTVKMLSPQAEAKGIRIKMDLKVGIPDLAFDPVRAGELLHNIIGNAIKYSYEKTEIRIISGEGPLGGHIIAFRNKGIGVPIGWELRIFEQGVIGPNADEAKLGGSGLGLAIAQKVATLHNWKLSLTSNADPTEFSLEVP